MASEFQVTQFAYGDEAGFGFWLDSHYRQHLRYNDVLAARTPAQVLPIWDILAIPSDMSKFRFWLDSHENWHSVVRPFANITGVNLADVDFRSESQFFSWLDLHAAEHAQLDLAFGVA